jgi:hypothetical protein
MQLAISEILSVILRPLLCYLSGNIRQKYDIDNREEKFPKEKIITLAKRFAEEQTKFLEKGDYAS